MQVKLSERLQQVNDEQNWELHERTWSVTRADGTCLPVAGHSETEPVPFSERGAYCEALKRMRMAESNDQLAALRRGLMASVPRLVLELLSWEELERRVCGSPEITAEMVCSNMSVDSDEEELSAEDERVVMLYQVLDRFSSKDLSHFLRFVSGRQRPPVMIAIAADSDIQQDSLPKSSTCANTLYLPQYSSLEMAERRIRYAIYNCAAIDTDLNNSDEEYSESE